MAKQDNAVSTVTNDGIPAYLQQYSGGIQKDNFDSSDIVIPRVKLLQGLSAEVEQYEEAKIGNFWHTGMDMDLGPEIRFVPIVRNKKYLLVAPLADGQGVLARADDFMNWNTTGKWDVQIGKTKKDMVTWEITDLNVKKSGLDQWGTYDPNNPDSPPAATMFYDYLALLPDHLDLGPVALSFTRSSIRPVRRGLNDKISLHQNNGRPMQSLVFVAKSVSEKSDSGDFKNWQFTSGGFAPENVFMQAVDLSNSLTDYRIKDEVDNSERSSGGAAPSENKEF